MTEVFSLYQPVNRLARAAPLYLQIAEGLLERIESGELAPGDRLPPERELSHMLGVNRLTLRRALRTLAAQGLVSRRQGRGTFVAEPKLERQASRLVSFTRGMQRRGLTPGARVVGFEERPVETSLARELKLPAGAPVYTLLRVRTINQEPVLLERYTLPVRRFPGLGRFDLEARSIYEILEREYGVTIHRARQSLEPVVSTEFEAGLLGIAPGLPMMLELRLSFDPSGEPVEHGRDLYRGDRFRFTTEIAPWEPDPAEVRSATTGLPARPSVGSLTRSPERRGPRRGRTE